MTERPASQEKPTFTLSCGKGQVEVSIGQTVDLFNNGELWAFEGLTDKTIRLGLGDIPMVKIAHVGKEEVEDYCLPRVLREDGRVLYEIPGDTFAHSVLEQRQLSTQIINPVRECV